MKIFDMAGRAHGACIAARSHSDISGGDCTKEQSKRAQEKTDACDCCQNQMEHTEGMRCVRPTGARAVRGASYIM